MELAIVGHLKRFNCLVHPCGGGTSGVIRLVGDSGIWAAIRLASSNTLRRHFPGDTPPRVLHSLVGSASPLSCPAAQIKAVLGTMLAHCSSQSDSLIATQRT